MSLKELVLSHTDNEMTSLPFWFIAAPAGVGRRVMLRGIWFNREDAEAFLKSRAYRFPKSAFVYCDSGHDSEHVKELYALARGEDK